MAQPLLIDVLEEIYEEDSSRINLIKLASMLHVPQNQLAEALGLERTAISKNPLLSPQEKHLKKWMVVFNFVIEYIREGEPTLSKQKIFLKMQRWLTVPQKDLDNNTPLDFMLKGKIRRVINLLEQLVG